MRPGQIEPNELERAILDRIVEEQPSACLLLTDLRVLSREYTGVGSFTEFRCEASGEEVEGRRVILGLEELIRVPGVPNGMGALLFCKGARADCLEIYTYGDDHWDGVYEGFSIGGVA